MSNPWARRALPWLIIVAFFVVWQLACWLFRIDVFILPAPTNIFASFAQYWQPILEHSFQTLLETIIGLGIAVIFGLALGIALGASKLVYDALYPIMIAFNSVPKVAVVPVMVIWFGIGTLPAVLTAFLISFFPIVVNVATGLATIEPEMQDVLRSLGARKLQIITKIGIPRAMPYFFASLKVAITLAFVGAIISEMTAANKGIGYLMNAAAGRFDVPLVFAGLLVIAVMGVAMYELFAFLERRVTFWATRANDIVS